MNAEVPLYDVVVPTIGRPTLVPLVDRLLADNRRTLGRVVVVDDREEQRSGRECRQDH